MAAVEISAVELSAVELSAVETGAVDEPAEPTSLLEHVGTASLALSDIVLGDPDLAEVLRGTAQLAARLVPSARSCGVTVGVRGAADTCSATDALTMEVDSIQYTLDIGPCLDSLSTGRVIEVTDLATDPRYLPFGVAAAERGLHSALSVPVSRRDSTVAVLNLYADHVDAFDTLDREIAIAFGAQLAVTLTGVIRVAGLTDHASDLEIALTSRVVIDRAVGIIMGSRHCSADEAFAVLRRTSQETNVKLRVIAERLVADAPTGGQPLRPRRPRR